MAVNSAPSLVRIGIDPGFDRVGWAVGKSDARGEVQLLNIGCIQTNKQRQLVERYAHIELELGAILDTYQPQEAHVETLFFSVNKKTALTVAEARGVIISCLIRHHVRVIDISPTSMKQAATGYGKADKAAVEKMIKLRLGKQLQVYAPKLIDDTYDAIGLLMVSSSLF